ncbi:hypothetical protein GN244_ATG00735 [Phytophthora infestans]|uniref:Uncharacterized protein n=1 Tax=Phytophthora infestans TaxID=4787 RepID=A0A833TG75_PHYIN|nr:hypothetical protein GN244_ATG00735 [Phytophthora infestans]
MVGPTCKQCEALLLNPQRSTTDARARCVGCGKLQYGYALRTISGRDIVRRCIACENGPKAVELWEEKPPPPESAEVRRQESLASAKKAMGPDRYPKKKKEAQPPSQAIRPKRQLHRAKEAAEEQVIWIIYPYCPRYPAYHCILYTGGRREAWGRTYGKLTVVLPIVLTHLRSVARFI